MELLKVGKKGKQASDFFVPDLTPEAHPEAKDFVVQYLFVAESPHVSEITPPRVQDRRPLCGVAGKQWWSLLSELLEGEPNDDVSLKHLLSFCVRHQIAVANAVQWPLDPKITRYNPEADPLKTVGFSKIAGATGYKKMKAGKEVKRALSSLSERLTHPSLAQVGIYPLGGDADWFIRQAIEPGLLALRMREKIPHPSAWWRQNGLFGRIAREKLSHIFTKEKRPSLSANL
jgi:hypothetical protein